MSLRDFLEKMEAQNEIMHIGEKVSPRFEISSILNAFPRGPILHFKNVEGTQTHIISNVCGTRNRICSSVNCSSEALYETLLTATKKPTPPAVVKSGPVSEIKTDPDLEEIPVLTHFEKDKGPYISSAIVSARDVDGKIENVSIHRLLVLDDRHLAIRLVPRHLFRLWNLAKKQKNDLDVAIAVGLHPAVLLAAASSPAFGVSEYGIANVLLGGKLRLLKCTRVDAYAPMDSEIVLEGRMSFDRESQEGPFVDITESYDAQRMQPIIELVGIMHRRDYMYQVLLPGGPEHRLLMGMPREAAIYESVSKVVPKVKEVNLTNGGCSWLHAVISIEKQTDGDAKNALLAAFAGHPSLKHAVVVDSDINVFNMEEVEWATATRFQPSEDLILIPKARGSTLDPSADIEKGETTKWGVDATRPTSIPKANFEKATVPTSKKTEEMITKIRNILETRISR